MKKKSPVASDGQFLVYQTEDGKLKIDVRFQGETVWLFLNQLAELSSAINRSSPPYQKCL